MATGAATVINPQIKLVKALGKIALFADLPEPVLTRLCEFADVRRYRAGQTVLSQGQYDASEFFAIVKGRLRSSTMDAASANMLVEDYRPGDVFSLEFAFADESEENLQLVSAMAEEDLSVLAIDAAAFVELAAQRPTLMRNVTRYLSRALSARRFRFAEVETSPERRIYAALLEITERNLETGDWRIANMPKHRELAEIAGVDDADAAGAVASLIQDGVARRDYPGLVIADFDRLRALSI